MSQWVDRVESHQAFAELTEFGKTLDLVKEACQQDKALLDHWDRAAAVATRARRVLGQVDPIFVVPASLANLQTALQQACAEIASFAANKNAGHWNNAQTHLDACLNALNAFPVQTSEGLDDMREAAAAYRTSISELLKAVKESGESVFQQQSALQTRLAELTTEIAAQKQRLDTAISTFQQQFSDGQQARQTDFATAEQSRTTASLKNEEARREEFDETERKRAALYEQTVAGERQRYDDLVAQLTRDTTKLIAAMEAQKAHAQKVVGIISDTGMSFGYQKTANEERGEASTWKRVASMSLVAWIVVGVVFFALTYDKDLTWPAVFRQLLISTPFVLLAGFAALQVTRHQKNERRLRQAELELASIDPFLATLSDAERNDVKKDFASRYFGQRESDPKQVGADAKIVEMVSDLAKAVHDIQQAIKK